MVENDRISALDGLSATPLVLAIMDGVGLAEGRPGDAVSAAKTPFLDSLAERAALYTTLAAHGVAVGMPSDNDMGNSEVGHNCMGAGQIIAQGAKRVAQAIGDGSIFEGRIWKALIEQLKPSLPDDASGRRHTLHFLGLLSDGNVHSHIEHLFALMKQAWVEGISCIRIHALLDGRDVDATSAHLYAEQLEKVMDAMREQGCDVAVASGGGRMHMTMDRYQADWPMVQRGWETHVHAQGPRFKSLGEAIESMRQDSPGIGDQYLPAFVIEDASGEPLGTIQDGDAVIAFNFRGDRMLEICQCFEADDLEAFDRGIRPNVFFAGMTLYDGDSSTPRNYLVDPPKIENVLSERLASLGIKQFACSETQKYGHVTYFWNGNRSGKFDEETETYVEIPSLPTPFEEQPKMQAEAITDAVIKALPDNDFLRINYANGDMVGHTGDFDAAMVAVTCVDHNLSRLWQAVEAAGGILVITADHGNADEMFRLDAKNQPKMKDGVVVVQTSHSKNRVPFAIMVSKTASEHLKVSPTEIADDQQAGLGNIAATLMALMGLSVPEDYLKPLIQVHRA